FSTSATLALKLFPSAREQFGCVIQVLMFRISLPVCILLPGLFRSVSYITFPTTSPSVHAALLRFVGIYAAMHLYAELHASVMHRSYFLLFLPYLMRYNTDKLFCKICLQMFIPREKNVALGLMLGCALIFRMFPLNISLSLIAARLFALRMFSFNIRSYLISFVRLRYLHDHFRIYPDMCVLNSLVDSIKFLFSVYTENMIEVFKLTNLTNYYRMNRFLKKAFYCLMRPNMRPILYNSITSIHFSKK
ncbi:hypothetical protein L9F63_002339, partial [Diploptera punctata]